MPENLKDLDNLKPIDHAVIGYIILRIAYVVLRIA